MARKRSKLNDDSREFVLQVVDVLDDLKSYWPLTLRQVYYQLVSKLIIPNNDTEYRKLSVKLTKGRLEGLVPWEALEDRSRSTHHSAGWEDQASFVEREVENLLEGYRRDLLANQPHSLELWVEKDALSKVCHDVAFRYCVPVIVARGFSSISYVNECRKRIKRNYEIEDRPTRILYFGDLDPSGWEMLPAMLETLQDEMGLGDLVEGVRCALMPDQVKKHKLPKDPTALKKTDSRAKKYQERFGNLAVELDALSPPLLQQIVKDSIVANLDVAEFNRQVDLQSEERRNLKDLRSDVLAFIEERLEEE